MLCSIFSALTAELFVILCIKVLHTFVWTSSTKRLCKVSAVRSGESSVISQIQIRLPRQSYDQHYIKLEFTKQFPWSFELLSFCWPSDSILEHFMSLEKTRVINTGNIFNKNRYDTWALVFFGSWKVSLLSSQASTDFVLSSNCKSKLESSSCSVDN